MAFVLRNTMLIFVCSKRLANFRMSGLWISEILRLETVSLWWVESFISCSTYWFILVMSKGKCWPWLYNELHPILFVFYAGQKERECIWLSRYLHAAALCSMGWIETKSIIVSVVMCFRQISISAVLEVSDYISRLLHGVQAIKILKFTSVLVVVIHTSTRRTYSLTIIP